MKSEILVELENNYFEINKLIKKQQFTVGDAELYLRRYNNIIRRMEDLIISRDSIKSRLISVDDKWRERMKKADIVWEERYSKLKNKFKKLQLEHQ